MLGFCCVLLPFLVSSGFCRGLVFCWFFSFADLVWFQNRLVYIFSANSVNGRKQMGGKKKKLKKKTPGAKKSAVFMGNKEFFPEPVPLHPRSGVSTPGAVSTLPGAVPSSHPAPARLNPLRRFPTGQGGCWKSPSCSQFLFKSLPPHKPGAASLWGEAGGGQGPCPQPPAPCWAVFVGCWLPPPSPLRNSPVGQFSCRAQQLLGFWGFGAWVWWP